MAVLQSTNVQGALCVNGVAVGGGKDFKFYCFTASDTWTPSQDLVDGGGTVSSIAVAGGGGGGAAASLTFTGCASCVFAGGGGGGEVDNSLNTITATTGCTVTVGAGGAGGDATNFCTVGDAGKGGDTSFHNTTVYGGGGGASRAYSCQCSQNFSTCTNIIGGPVGGCSYCTINYYPDLVQPVQRAINGAGGSFGSNNHVTRDIFLGVCGCTNPVGFAFGGKFSKPVSSSAGAVCSSATSGERQVGVLGFGRGGINSSTPQRYIDGKACAGDGGRGYNTAGNTCTDGEAGQDGLVILTWME